MSEYGLPRVTYFVQLWYADGDRLQLEPDEECEWVTLDEAMKQFQMLSLDDYYCKVKLISYDWISRTTTEIKSCECES